MRFHEVRIPAGDFRLAASLTVPRRPRAMVVFAHGNGVTRHDSRLAYVAHTLEQAGFATLRVDLLDPCEAADPDNALDVDLQAERLVGVTRWAQRQAGLRPLRTGYFGTDAGSEVALVAGARASDSVHGIVCRAGRPDTAFDWLRRLQAPTLFIAEEVGGEPDWISIACSRCAAVKELVVVPAADPALPDSDEQKAVAHHAARWFERYVATAATASTASA